MQAFRVRLPSGTCYWTVVDDDFRVFGPADSFLREVRLAMGRAESTTKAYAHAVVLFLLWCTSTRRDWRTAAQDMGLFMLWLRWTPGRGGQRQVVVPGPGSKPVRGDRRINKVLTGVRLFLVHAMNRKEAPAWVLNHLYELGDALDLPLAAQGEPGGMRVRLRARHQLQEPETDIDRASDEEVVAMLLVCRSARDRLTLLLLSRVGLRPGQTAGLRRSDPHLMTDSRALGCDVEGPHIHVIRRQNENDAWSKSKKSWVMPVDFLVVQAFDQYAVERHEILGDDGSDFLLVNLFRPPFGSPITTDAIGELCEALSRRAGLDRIVTPRMCRHAMASNVADAGGKLDEIQALLGQKHPESPRPYLHPKASRLREAVERVPSPRLLTSTGQEPR
ncbi:tyrosine-type recombinase/integrase [Streptomyces sp. NBC_00378]|uniref:tyrosine-type recombinase/integrase n=1 Tax=unclassified Streptomyces TaxID=2593676 RepID=UPI00224ED4C2|nr:MULTISPECIES: tyrosine-type recombinase/integrase [unclassified Streptomyces]MCX5115248.1 tyrosine-type recombinase/integrase [Streptomyces sp. NBC_00378]